MTEPTRRKRRSQKERRPAPVKSSHSAKRQRKGSSQAAHTRTQDALRESELRFRTLAECAPVVVWMTDADYRCTYVSGYWHEFTGRDPEKDLGFGWVGALHPDDRQPVVDELKKARRSLIACKGEYRVTRANGEMGWLYYYGVPHLHADGTYAGHIGTCIDITHHKAIEKAAVQVQNSLVLGQEAERKRVANELHDDVVQNLALVGLRLREAQQSCKEESPVLAAKLNTLRQQVQSIALDIHRISHNLHPAALVHLGLVSALRSLCREFSERTRVAIDFRSDLESIDASAEVSIAMYRVTQESLTNVVRHSRSAHANVALTEHSGALHLTITDAGIGFERKRVRPTAGLGLISIRERARMIGARVEVASIPQRGTRVELCVPIAVLGGTNQNVEEIPPSGV